MQQNSNPLTWDLSTWILAIIMASSGGVINCLDLIRTNKTHRISLMAFVGEFFTAGFVGVGIFMALLAYNFEVGVAAFAACVCGHYSTRLLFKIEQVLDSKLNTLIDTEKKEEQ